MTVANRTKDMNTYRNWRTTETEYIRANWHTMNDAKISGHLNRSELSVRMMRCRLRLVHYNRRDMDYYQKEAERIAYNRMVRKSRSIDAMVKRMRHLIVLIETASNEYQRQKYIPELKKLSGL